MIKKRNALYISYDGMTDSLGQSQVLPYLKGLSKEGYRFQLISFEKPERFEKYRETIQRFCNEAGIDWHPLMYTKNPPLLSTVWDVFRMKRLAKQLHETHRFSTVHCRSYIAALVGRNMKSRFGTKFIFDMRGFWADERIDGKIWSLSNPVFKAVYGYFKRKEIQFFREADYIISLTENGKQEIQSWKSLKGYDLKIQVIPCCVDLQLFDPKKIAQESLTALKKDLKISTDQRVLGYVGSIGTWYMLPEMLDYFAEFQRVHPSSVLLFVTNEQPESIRSIAAEKGISAESLRIVSCLHHEVPKYIALFNQSIFFIRPTYSKKASSPTKQGEIMAMGIPLICNAGVGDTDYIVQKFQAGKVIQECSVANYREAIQTEIQFSPETIQHGAHVFFSLEEGIKRYLQVYRAVID